MSDVSMADPSHSHDGGPPAAHATPNVSNVPAPRESDPAARPRDDVPPIGTSAPAEAFPAASEHGPDGPNLPDDPDDPDGPDDHIVCDADVADAEGQAASAGQGDAPALG